MERLAQRAGKAAGIARDVFTAAMVTGFLKGA
jgi:hypothetical protein